MSATHMEVANGFFKALLAGDAAALDTLFAPQAVFWQNFLGREIAKEEFLLGFARLSRLADDLHFEDVRRTATATGFVEQHTLCGRASSGGELALRGCFIVTVEEGRIVRLNEYLDSAQLSDFTRQGGRSMDATGKTATLDRFFAAIQRADLATVESIYHPDCVIWHNNDNATQTVAENLRVLSWVSRNVQGVSYDDIRRTPMESGQVVQEHVLHGVAPNGKPLSAVACIVFTFSEDGRIIRLEEYLDSAQVAVLRA